MKDRAYKWLFYVIAAVLIVVVYFSSFDIDAKHEQIHELLKENIQLKKQLILLEQKTDSIDLLLKYAKVDTGFVIKNRIITRYEKEFQNIDNADADSNFSIFAKWISQNDSIAGR